MEAVAVQVIDDVRNITDASVAAHAIMPNHLHLLVIQGSQPLDRLMQPLLRRLALAVQRHNGKDGHVFQGRYKHKACLDPDYLRNAIAYIHLNAARKGLCTCADDFAWCSHPEYRSAVTADLATTRGATTAMMARMFADRIDDSLENCVRNYEWFLRWRLECDRLRADPSVHLLPLPPSTRAGDAHWYATFNSSCVAAAERQLKDIPRMDLRDFMQRSLQDVAPEMPLAFLRSGDSTRALVRVRRAIMLRALIAGYRGTRIARFLRVSDATVSRLRTEVRRSR